MDEPRDAATRKSDTLAKLLAPAADAWVSTAADGDPYLVPLSLAWLDGRAVLALSATSRTARNLAATGTARLSVGATRDVVMLDCTVEATHPVESAPPPLSSGYAAQSDWDPRTAPGYVYAVLRPQRIQAWREANELPGRTLMHNGEWLV